MLQETFCDAEAVVGQKSATLRSGPMAPHSSSTLPTRPLRLDLEVLGSELGPEAQGNFLRGCSC